MKITALFLFVIVTTILSCEKDPGRLPAINFKTGGNYISKDTLLEVGTRFLIGINAAKTESKDILKQFNISVSVNDSANRSLYTESLSGSNANAYTYDFTSIADSIHGQKNKYTFTIVNRDGIINQLSLTINTL